MENLTEKQEKHKQKIELLSRLIDEKAITLVDALLLLSNTEETVSQSIPSGPIPRTIQPADIKYYGSGTGTGTTFIGYSNTLTTGQLSNLTTSSNSIGTQIVNEYLNNLDSQE